MGKGGISWSDAEVRSIVGNRMTAPLKHRTLSAAIVDRLRQAILAGTYPAGTQLRQDAMAETYGVSRIPVREALFQLEAEGFVRIVPHKGAIVSELSLDEINDVFDLRCLLEPRLLSQSAPRFSEADFAALDAIHARFETAIAAGDVGQWGVINAEFHMALYTKARQPRTQSIVAALLQTSDRYTRLQLSNTAAMGIAEQEHAELIRQCRSGRFTEAAAFLVGHIEAVRADLLRVVARSGAAGGATNSRSVALE
jgi:DNA-binding GntR family transcriptional regulator